MLTALFSALVAGAVRQAECHSKDDLINRFSVGRTFPILPNVDAFGSNLYDDEDEDSSHSRCDVTRLRECITNREKLLLELESESNSADTDERFESACRIARYSSACLRREGCEGSSSLRAAGVPSRTAAIVSLALRLDIIRCENPRFANERVCITEVFARQRAAFQQCASTLERSLKNRADLDALCRATSVYSRCVQRAVLDECGESAALAVCELADAVSTELLDPQHCNTPCSEWLHSFGRAAHIVGSEPPRVFLTHKGINANCNLSLFADCLRTFKEQLDAKESSGLDFLEALKELLRKKTRKGFQTLCGSYRQLETCADGRLQECFAADFLHGQMRLSKAEATLFNITAFALRHQCSSDVFEKRFDCLHGIARKDKKALWECERRFREEIKESPYCSVSQSLLRCVSSRFARSCGAAASKAICHFERAILKRYASRARSCSLVCDW